MENGIPHGKLKWHLRRAARRSWFTTVQKDQTRATLEEWRACGSDGFVVQADESQQDEMHGFFARVRSEFASLDTKRSPCSSYQTKAHSGIGRKKS